jgi:hypothetical protein
MAIRNQHEMSRRHFAQHCATAAATIPAVNFLSHVQANAAALKSSQKACILMWLGGGAPTIDMWDLKPESKNGGELKPIDTSVPGLQISEGLPETAKVFQDLSIVRSMSTREADHGRGRYYMQTSYVPNATVIHPVFGSVVSYEFRKSKKRPLLEIPSFVSIDGGAGEAGFLGMAHAPFAVDSNGQVRNAPGDAEKQRLQPRLAMLKEIEKGFMESRRGELPTAHRDVYESAVNLMVSPQMAAFSSDRAEASLGLERESDQIRDAYGRNSFGSGLLMARRLVQTGVPFVEVNMGGWDLHQGVFDALRTQRLPQLDKGIAALVADLKQRGMLNDVVLVCMGEFGRTPRINQDVGRDHWATSWSVMMGGGGLKNGQAVGATNSDGTQIAEGSKSYLPGDIWATVALAMGIPLDAPHTSKNGRPMKIANGGTPVQELIG